MLARVAGNTRIKECSRPLDEGDSIPDELDPGDIGLETSLVHSTLPIPSPFSFNAFGCSKSADTFEGTSKRPGGRAGLLMDSVATGRKISKVKRTRLALLECAKEEVEERAHTHLLANTDQTLSHPRRRLTPPHHPPTLHDQHQNLGESIPPAISASLTALTARSS